MMADVFLAKSWTNWLEFEADFAQYCRETYQVFATLDSRTVERQNARLSVNAVHYKPELKYAYMRYGCIYYGQKYSCKVLMIC